MYVSLSGRLNKNEAARGRLSVVFHYIPSRAALQRIARRCAALPFTAAAPKKRRRLA
jgi:hypothetical protein